MNPEPSRTIHKPILTTDEKRLLAEMAASVNFQKFRVSKHAIKEVMVDFVYASALIEGNDYNVQETEDLLDLGYTSAGKKHADALMILNLRRSFEDILKSSHGSPDMSDVQDIHATVTEDLLLESERGQVRQCEVTISSCEYTPPADPKILWEELKFIIAESKKYEDVFERAIYLHCNIAYLQFFKDGNKRTARMTQTSTLVGGGVAPVLFNFKFVDLYRAAVVHYYETGDYEPYKMFFFKNYKTSLKSIDYLLNGDRIKSITRTDNNNTTPTNHDEPKVNKP